MSEYKILWKDSYKLGIDIIDDQHKKLFDMVGELIEILDSKDWDEGKKKCESAVEFLKDYVVTHFRDEEEYQKEIGYKDHEKHKKIHDEFTKSVLEHEKKFLESGFDKAEVRKFVGMVIAWLIYHVTDCDQRIVKDMPTDSIIDVSSHIEQGFCSTAEVLNMMTGIDKSQLKFKDSINSQMSADLYVIVGLIGEFKGNLIFGFSKELAFEVVKIMTCMEMTEIDEMVFSAMAEISNIICGNMTITLESKDVHCDITPPEIYNDLPAQHCDFSEKIDISTTIGPMQLAMVF